MIYLRCFEDTRIPTEGMIGTDDSRIPSWRGSAISQPWGAGSLPVIMAESQAIPRIGDRVAANRNLQSSEREIFSCMKGFKIGQWFESIVASWFLLWQDCNPPFAKWLEVAKFETPACFAQHSLNPETICTTDIMAPWPLCYAEHDSNRDWYLLGCLIWCRRLYQSTRRISKYQTRCFRSRDTFRCRRKSPEARDSTLWSHAHFKICRSASAYQDHDAFGCLEPLTAWSANSRRLGSTRNKVWIGSRGNIDCNLRIVGKEGRWVRTWKWEIWSKENEL